MTTECARAEEFLRLACLTYGGDNAARRERARELLAAHPDIASASIYTMAAVGDITAAAAVLADDPAQARIPGGPHDWEPLLYLAYSRLDSTAAGHSTLEMARLLLASGADPNAGYLWEGTYAFTALTGVLGEGEDAGNQPRHQFWLPLARLLLDAGADPNDSQDLYNRMFAASDDHLRLLFSYGLGSDTGGPWCARLGSALPSPAQMLQDQLLWAAEHNLVARVTLLLAHDVDPDGLGFWFTGAERRTAYQRAMSAGNTETAELLLVVGARRTAFDPAQEFISACLSVDRHRVDELVTADPTVVRQAIAVSRRNSPGRRARPSGRGQAAGRTGIRRQRRAGDLRAARGGIHRRSGDGRAPALPWRRPQPEGLLVRFDPVGLGRARPPPADHRPPDAGHRARPW